MTFVEELGNKIVSTGQKTSKAISEMSKVSRLKGAVNDELGRVNQVYTKIGEAWYERYGADATEDPFLALSEQVREIKARIAGIEDEIMQIQNEKACPQCGAVCSYDSMFCYACGCKFPEPQQVAEVVQEGFCTNCGAQLKEGAAFCVECGQPVKAPVAEAAVEAAPAEVEAADEDAAPAEPDAEDSDADAPTAEAAGEETPDAEGSDDESASAEAELFEDAPAAEPAKKHAAKK